MAKPINKRTKIEPVVLKTGDGTADDVVRANISYVPGAESVQIQIKYWDEIKAYHIKTILVDADQVANIVNTFSRNLCSNCRPSYRYMESADSYETKKEGRASSNAYNGATGVSPEDAIDKLNEKIVEGFDNGISMENIAQIRAKKNEIQDEEVTRINNHRLGGGGNIF